VSILAISQGSSERSISVVIKHSDALAALTAVHHTFYVPLESTQKKIKLQQHCYTATLVFFHLNLFFQGNLAYTWH
jgi:hypothetical protein